MKIINFTNKTSEILFSVDELSIIKNSLLEVYNQFAVNDFATLIPNISKNEAIQLNGVLEKIIDAHLHKYDLMISSHMIQSIHIKEKGAILLLTYEVLVGIRSILNVLYHGACIKIEDCDFSRKIGFNRTDVLSLLDSIRKDVIDKMEENRLETLVFKRSREILENLKSNYSRSNTNGVNLQIRNKCQFQLQSHQIIFLLSTQNKTNKIFNGIQILINKNLTPAVFFAKSNAGLIRHNDLFRLIAYLELAIEPTTNKIDLEEYIFSLFYTSSPLLDLQVISHSLESEGERNIKLRFRLYSPIQEDNIDNEYLEIVDTFNAGNIYSFTSSVRDFLLELSMKESQTSLK
jgi:hypothetical protein